MPTTLNELEAVRVSCRKLVVTRSAASAAVSAIPIPGPDVLADVGMLMEMIPVINRRFGLSPEQIEELPAPLQGAIMSTATRIGGAGGRNDHQGACGRRAQAGWRADHRWTAA